MPSLPSAVAMAAQLRTSLRVYPYVLQHMVASLYEARIRQSAADQTDFFVGAFECGVNDCAIDVRPGTSHNGEGAANITVRTTPKSPGRESPCPLGRQVLHGETR